MNPRKRKARVLAALKEAAETAAKTETLLDDVLLKRTAEMAVETGMITEGEAKDALKPLEKIAQPKLKKPLIKEATDGKEKQTTTTRTKKTTKSTKKRTTKPAKKRTTKRATKSKD